MPERMDQQLTSRVKSQQWVTRQSTLFPLLVFALAIACSLLGAIATERSERQNTEVRLSNDAEEIKRSLDEIYLSHRAMLGANALFLERADITPSEFNRFASAAIRSVDSTGIQAVGWAVAEYTDKSTLNSVKVKFLSPDNVRNRRALGFNTYSEANRRAAVSEAVRSRNPTATAPIILAQEARSQPKPGFLLYMPVFTQAGTLKGLVYTAYQGDMLLASAIKRSRASIVFAKLSDSKNDKTASLATYGKIADSMAYKTLPMDLGGRKWMVTVGAPESPVLSQPTMWVLLAGLLLSGIALQFAQTFVGSAMRDARHFEWQREQLQIRDALTRELNHRVKNTLANVLSIIALTRRRAESLDSFTEGLTGRLRALSATHDLLTKSEWSNARIEEIVSAELAPYLGPEHGRASIKGSDVSVAPNTALSLGLAIHELATNASKYGALSSAEGSVQVTWVESEPGILKIRWQESGGPPVVKPSHAGFGTALLQKIVAHELGKPVELEFLPGGLCCTLFAPIRQTRNFALRAGVT